MFIDEVQITVKGGHGGAGAVSFFAKKGGPCGGNGGKGGDVYVRGDSRLSSLNNYIEKKTYEATDGGKGENNRKTGKDGNTIILRVPIGTTLTDLETKERVEIDREDKDILVAKGGIGGRGNEAFKSPTHQTPTYSEKGKEGQERHLNMSLALIADFGFIGLPNAGKSSLLNMLTAANVKTADYPFTTLEPNLGVFDGKVIADIPGLIEGASKGKGLGIKFLKHIERVKLLLHCISCESQDVQRDYETVLHELSEYNPNLAKKASVILLTKTDLVSSDKIKKTMNLLKTTNMPVYPISIYNKKSLEKLKELLR